MNTPRRLMSSSGCPRVPCAVSTPTASLDERQITHLICARLKYDPYDFFRERFGAFLYKKQNRKQAQNTPKKVI